MSNERSAYILDVAPVVPQFSYNRNVAIDVSNRVFAADPDTRDFVNTVLSSVAIEKRHSVLPDYHVAGPYRMLLGAADDFRPEATTAARNRIFVREAPRLAAKACNRLLGHELDPRRITHLLTASCTGFHAPGFDVHLVKSLNLRRSVHRTHVGFMGCFAGFSTLKLADAICRADPDALVLIVHVELCTLHVRFEPARDVQVANAIFGDGAAAALVAGDRSVASWPQGPAFRTLGATSHLLPDSEEEMTWNIGDQGFEMRLSPRVPSLLRRHLPEVFQHSMDAMRLSRADIRHWAIHPGGPAIVDRVRQALDLDESNVQISRDVLRDYGNMSSATLWFLLDRIRRQAAGGTVFACGFGPGLTVESATLEYEGAASS